MTPRDLVINAINQKAVLRAPRDIWLAPGLAAARPDEVAEINIRFPSDIVTPAFAYAPSKRAQGNPRDAAYVDAWGCGWTTAPGASPMVKDSPLSDVAKIAAYQPPVEILAAEQFAEVNKSCATPRFVLAMTEVRPFERFQALRGAKAAIHDLQRGATEPLRLLAMLHEFYCREIELWANTDVDGVALGDVWGTNDALLVPPAVWREHFKPLYEDYCRILHAKDKFVFFVSGGKIADILYDLTKIEVDAIHSRWALMDLERLAKRFGGKITFWGGLDREEVLRTGSPQEIRNAVLRVREALDAGQGGIIAQCRWDQNVPLRSLATFCEQWMMPMPVPAVG